MRSYTYYGHPTFCEDNPVLNSNAVWKDVVGFEGLYKVSDAGEVVSSGEYIKSRRGVALRANPTGTSDYLYVKLWRGNKMFNRSVHRLVAQAFIPNPLALGVVNHKDGDKRNNALSNLEWCSMSENHRHAYATGLKSAESQRRRFLGTKQGGMSKYHNVSWDSTRSKWIGAVKHHGKCLGRRRFSSEHEAAQYVNELIDKHNLLDRPRNCITEMPND